ncbi:MAG: hypothetical protein B6D59_06390 [Campylobacteraceae bacterium 4484_4]|nr:MAG: hypothetical protein B6D59_06390 [Campylobacteraceae bacterium 4484_4]
MPRKAGKVFVWPLCTRIIHWMIVLSFVTAFITSFYEHLLHYHVGLGALFGIMLIYRTIWGFIGPRYATFNTFKLRPVELKDYFVEKVRDRWRKIPPGHNPASSWYTLLVLSTGIVIVVSGLLLYGIEEGKGFFSFLNPKYYTYMDLLGGVHKYSAYFLAVWACIHITGVLIEQFYHKTSMVFAMITGYKKSEGLDTEMCPWRNVISYGTILAALFNFYIVEKDNDNIFVKSRFEPIDYKKENRDFATECGDCHKPYPPYLLPERSWERIIADLDNHFGEEITEANITKAQQANILAYLKANSAEHSTHEAAFKILKSLNGRAPKAVTKTPYWRAVHKEIPRWVFKHKKVKDKSNCKACHIDFEKGILEDRNIRVPVDY